MKLKFWDKLKLNYYCYMMVNLLKDINKLTRYSKQTKSISTKLIFKEEITKLKTQFNKLDAKARAIEDKYS
jgi:hypothetical protein